MKLAAAALIGLIAWSAGGGTAAANTCRALEMQLSQMQFGGGSSRQVAGMRDLLVDRGCRGGGRRAKARLREATPVRLERRARSEQSIRANRRSKRQDTARAGVGGTFRTLCVRTCDGYYFPISFSTTRKHFATDEAACRQQCPASETALYYHGAESQGAQDMLSLSGAPYASLPNAFRHHQMLDKSCTCSAPQPISTIALAPTVEVELVARAPSARPQPGEDPETLANRVGGFVPAPVDKIAAASSTTIAVRNVVPPAPSVSLLTTVPN